MLIKEAAAANNINKFNNIAMNNLKEPLKNNS